MNYSCATKIPRYEQLLAATRHFPELDPTAAEAYLNLLRAADEVVRVREASLADSSLSCGRFGVLMQLLNKLENRPESRTPAELADLVGVTRATMTGLVDTLERDGLVRREPDPDDRRMMAVHLTAKGEADLRRALPKQCRMMAEIMAPLSEAERKTLVGLLQKALPALTAEPAAPTKAAAGVS